MLVTEIVSIIKTVASGYILADVSDKENKSTEGC